MKDPWPWLLGLLAVGLVADEYRRRQLLRRLARTERRLHSLQRLARANGWLFDPDDAGADNAERAA